MESDFERNQAFFMSFFKIHPNSEVLFSPFLNCGFLTLQERSLDNISGIVQIEVILRLIDLNL